MSSGYDLSSSMGTSSLVEERAVSLVPSVTCPGRAEPGMRARSDEAEASILAGRSWSRTIRISEFRDTN